jgi:hypothetical protein
MARKAFLSFHCQLDNWRVSQVRNMGAIEGQPLLGSNAWEDVALGGDAAIFSKGWPCFRADQELGSRNGLNRIGGRRCPGRKAMAIALFRDRISFTAGLYGLHLMPPALWRRRGSEGGFHRC